MAGLVMGIQIHRAKATVLMRPVLASYISAILLFDLTLFGVGSYTAKSLHAIGQVAQLVERGPEKAGVGGSIPSLATN